MSDVYGGPQDSFSGSYHGVYPCGDILQKYARESQQSQKWTPELAADSTKRAQNIAQNITWPAEDSYQSCTNRQLRMSHDTSNRTGDGDEGVAFVPVRPLPDKSAFLSVSFQPFLPKENLACLKCVCNWRCQPRLFSTSIYCLKI